MSKELERLNRAQRIANIGNWDQDMRTGELWWSDQTYRIFGLVPHNNPVDFETFLEMVLPEDRAAIVEATEAAVGPDNAPYSVEYRVRHPDGGLRHLYEEAVVDRDTAGEAVRIMGVVHDVTERKQAEAALRRFEEQSRYLEKMEAVGTLAGGVAHEINNILGVIMGYTGLVQDVLDRDSEEAANLQEVIDASLRAKELVLQILVFSARKIGSRAPVDLGELVAQTLEPLRRSLPPQLALVTDLDPDVGSVVAVPAQIATLVTNLLRNAEAACAASGGAVLVSAKRVPAEDVPVATVPGLGRLDYVRLRVRDSGAGIEEKHLPRVFDPFFTTRTVGEGRGMGLAVVHGIVESHGGIKHLESAPGAGTTVDVYLPAQPLREPVLPANDDDRPKRVLLVDDDDHLREVTATILEKLGYQVDGAPNGFRALELFLAAPHRFDLVFTDQSMRGLSGIALARKVRALRPELPVIVCTGHSDLLETEEAARNGVQELLYKPLRARELEASLRSALG